MNRSTLCFSRMLLAVAVSAASVPLAYGYSLEPQQAGNITYVTGGIGDEDREAMKAVRNDYNLSIVSSATSGAYVGDTHVVISDRNGQTLVDTDADPLFYAQLPPGKYVIEGQSEGQSHTQNVTIADNKPAHIHFTWK